MLDVRMLLEGRLIGGRFRNEHQPRANQSDETFFPYTMRNRNARNGCMRSGRHALRFNNAPLLRLKIYP